MRFATTPLPCASWELVSLLTAICLAWPCSSTADETPLRFKIPGYNDPIVISATLDGVGHLCIVDSGASTNAFDSSLRDKLGASVEKVSIAGADGGKLVAEVFPSPLISLVTKEVCRDSPVVCFDLSGSREATGHNIEGVLGVPLFRETTILMDFDSQQLIITGEATNPAPDWGAPLDVGYSDSGLPMINVTLPNRPMVMCKLDTGFTGSISLPSDEFSSLVKKGDIRLLGDGMSVTLTGRRTSRSGIISSVRVGDFENRDLVVCDGGDKARIGLQYLRRFRVTCDLKHNRIYLAKGAKFDEPERQPIGIGILRKGGKTMVAHVEKNSVFAKSDVRENDELISVAGLSISEQPIGEIHWLIRKKSDSSGNVVLGFRRDGKEHRLSIYIPD